MFSCHNCNTEFEDKNSDGLVIMHSGRPAAAICPACVSGARVVKLVLRRNDKGAFGYDQYTAIEMVSKAFGKAG